MVKWWNFVCSKIRVLSFAPNNFQKHVVRIFFRKRRQWRHWYLPFWERVHFHISRTDEQKSMKLYKSDRSDMMLKSAKFGDDSAIFDGDMTSSFLTSRRIFGDVITPSFLSVTSQNCAKCFVLIKWVSFENFIKIEVVEHIKLELRQKQEKIRHFSDLWRHNPVKNDSNFVKLSQMLDTTKMSAFVKF